MASIDSCQFLPRAVEQSCARFRYDTIRAGDPDAAEAAMKEHLAFVIREFKRKFFPA
jgi:DNA-binding FadR family transcriptional regulator